MNVLITGGNGFIGTNLTRYLIDRKCKVTILDKKPNPTRSWEKHFVTTHIVDITDHNQHQRKFYKNKDVVIHLAGISSLPENQVAPHDCIQSNVAGTLNVLEHARGAGVPRIIFSSTSAVYENCDRFPVMEYDQVSPHLLYSASKKMCEDLCRSYAECYGMWITAIRYFNVYGPSQDFKRSSPPLTSYIPRELVNGRQPTLYKWSEKLRDYVYVDDVNELNWLCMNATRDNEYFKIFNAASGEPVSVEEIYKIFARVLRKDINPFVLPAQEIWDNYPQLFQGPFPLKRNIVHKEASKYCSGSYRKAFAYAGWRPTTSLEAGLTKIAKYAQSNMVEK